MLDDNAGHCHRLPIMSDSTVPNAPAAPTAPASTSSLLSPETIGPRELVMRVMPMPADANGNGIAAVKAIPGAEPQLKDSFENWMLPDITPKSPDVRTGTGELSPDGKTLTWKYTYTCPINKKPTLLREVETITGPNTKTLEMFGTEPKSGKEFKMMSIELTRK